MSVVERAWGMCYSERWSGRRCEAWLGFVVEVMWLGQRERGRGDNTTRFEVRWREYKAPGGKGIWPGALLPTGVVGTPALASTCCPGPLLPDLPTLTLHTTPHYTTLYSSTLYFFPLLPDLSTLNTTLHNTSVYTPTYKRIHYNKVLSDAF